VCRVAAQKTAYQPPYALEANHVGRSELGRPPAPFPHNVPPRTSPSCDTRDAADLGGMRVCAYSHTAPASHWIRFSSYVSKRPGWRPNVASNHQIAEIATPQSARRSPNARHPPLRWSVIDPQVPLADRRLSRNPIAKCAMLLAGQTALVRALARPTPGESPFQQNAIRISPP